MSDKNILSLLAMEKLLKKAGAIRISDESKEILKNELEKIGLRIATKAVKLSLHANRRTIKQEDIKFAVEDF